MARGFSFDIKDILGIVEESEGSNWGIVLSRISWNGKEPVYDLRKFDLSTLESENVVMSKGVSFYSEEGLRNLSDILIENGYCNEKVLKKYLKKRESLFKPKGLKNIAKKL